MHPSGNPDGSFGKARSYRGRFAPSPSGPLHFGSLLAATASYLDARAQGGEWFVRMEDLDTPRNAAGAADAILLALEQFGFEWDGPVVYQSRRIHLYQAVFDQWLSEDLIYPCACSRKEIADSTTSGAPMDAQRYPGTCSHGLPPGKHPRSWRVRVPSAGSGIGYEDRLQGRQYQNVAETAGDFVVLRADGVFAYQFAVVIDDADQEVSDIVRGADLLDSTPRQIFLQRLLKVPSPHYLHIPVATGPDGKKLSKQNRARPLDSANAVAVLWDALSFLHLRPPPELRGASLRDLWRSAIQLWDPQKLAPVLTEPLSLISNT